jgi:branched-chain amino acid transport system ATP-binding protein
LSVFKTVTIGALARSNTLNQARRKAEEIISTLKLYDKKDKLGHSLTVIERKRLELARALATEPKLLLIDEVIAGLNPTEVDEISKTIRDLVKSGLTILMIEHVMRAVLSLTERAVVLDAGRMIAEGDPHDLLRDPVVIEAYIGKEDSDA